MVADVDRAKKIYTELEWAGLVYKMFGGSRQCWMTLEGIGLVWTVLFRAQQRWIALDGAWWV